MTWISTIYQRYGGGGGGAILTVRDQFSTQVSGPIKMEDGGGFSWSILNEGSIYTSGGVGWGPQLERFWG